MSSNLTLANLVTCLRIVLIPVWLFFAELVVPTYKTSTFSFAVFLIALLYVALALTDKLDGYLARSKNQVTDLGKFLDPIADKLVVFAAMLYLLEKNFLPLWLVMLVLVREFLVSALRMVVAGSGTVVAASWLGKAKTVVTMALLIVYLFALGIPQMSVFGHFWQFIVLILLWATVILTLWSGFDYFWRYGSSLLRK